MTTASKGRLLALVLLLVAGAVVAVAVFSNKPAPSNAGADDSTAYDAPPPVDPGDVATSESPKSLQDVIAGGAKGAWTSTREDGSVAMRILSERLDPKPEGRFELSAVASWFYSPSSRFRVTASRADLLWPRQDKTPESGKLSAMELALFPAASAEHPDENPGDPLLIGSLDSLQFDAAMSQLQSKDILRVSGSGVDLEAHGFTVRLNEVNRQISYLRIDPSPENRLTLGGPRKTSAPETEAEKQPTQPTDKPATDQPPANPPPPQIDYYALSLGGPVQIRQAERILTGERVTILLRLVNGKLADNAIAAIELPGGEKKSARLSAKGDKADKSPSSAFNTNVPTAITWAGPAELTLVDAAPELIVDDVYVRLDATERDPVTYADSALGVSMKCGRAEYFATTRRVSLEAQGPAPAVSFKTNDGLAFDTRRLSLDLSKLPEISGIATGPARASSTDATNSRALPATVAWEGESTFKLTAVGDTLVPTAVALAGAVKASSADGNAMASSINATFEPDANVRGRSNLTSLLLIGDAELFGSDESHIAADEIGVNFALSGDRPLPTFAAAKGHITGKTQDGELRSAGKLAVTLDVDAKGRTRAHAFDASEDVVLRTRTLASNPRDTADYVELHGDVLTGDLQTQVIDISGAPATIARISDADRGGVTGGTMRIEGASRRLSVFGPGSASRTLARKDDTGLDRLGVEWTTAMTYDDLSGRAECRGGVVATGEIRGTDRHVVQGDTLVLDITQAPAKSGSGKRELLSAIVSGSSFDPKGTSHARAESRRFVESSIASGTPRLEALLSIESQSLAVRPQDRSIEAPGPGRIVIEDRREAKPLPGSQSDVLVLGAPPATPKSGQAVTTRGTTIFTWQGGIHVDGPSNVATMSSGVRVRHKPAGSREVVDMECEKLDATFEPDPQDLANPRPREIVASGAIFVRRADLQLVGDRVRFIVGSNELVIEAEPGNLVSIDDAARGARATAEAVRLDTRTGAWTEIRRGSVTLPAEVGLRSPPLGR